MKTESVKNWTVWVFDNDYRALAYTEKFHGTQEQVDAYCTKESWSGLTYMFDKI